MELTVRDTIRRSDAAVHADVEMLFLSTGMDYVVLICYTLNTDNFKPFSWLSKGSIRVVNKHKGIVPPKARVHIKNNVICEPNVPFQVMCALVARYSED